MSLRELVRRYDAISDTTVFKSVKLPEALRHELRRLAREADVSVSAILRAAAALAVEYAEARDPVYARRRLKEFDRRLTERYAGAEWRAQPYKIPYTLAEKLAALAGRLELHESTIVRAGLQLLLTHAR